MSFESPALYRYYRNGAKTLDSLGDSVGPNDTELSNILWYASRRLDEYAKQFKKEEA